MEVGDIVNVDLRMQSTASDTHEPQSPMALKYGSKPAAVLSYIENVLLADRTARILLFSSYVESLVIMAETLREENIDSIVCGLEGDEKVSDSISRFQAPQSTTRVLLMNSKNVAAGTNLQIASYVMFLEPAGCNPSEAAMIETQAVGRTCRIGQVNHLYD